MVALSPIARHPIHIHYNSACRQVSQAYFQQAFIKRTVSGEIGSVGQIIQEEGNTMNIHDSLYDDHIAGCF
jgi:hypothetical protein